ncbi:zinc finger BED domain-containing protein 1-like [Rhizophagus irregularis DAOM 181602=DAOM 197198]|uniref:HAT C-terminal dimerisation domain-containing protein n=1 Tax=Rhizophagus irregularis (strain DAOM 197198w) TaxID=1432141 RepID=A0A015JA65_RHIIW|nr:hypothetical protein RirG_258920 [Rhizophagus irregularis DAOM 197198w]GBC41465.1 zinc finger BED domain-containing protein 1-like [Rhizophagus irregularis DAOM 181602=DAOM 197198]
MDDRISGLIGFRAYLYLGSSTYCTYSIINPFIEEIKEDLLNPFLSSLSLSSIQFSPQSFSQSVLQETQETDEDIFIEENIEIETNLNQPVNTSGLLKMVRTKLYKNLCKYWNFQDSNALLASLLDPCTKNLKHVSIQIKIKTEDLLRSKVEKLKLKEVDSSKLASSNSFNSTSKNLKYKNSIFSRFQKAKTRIVNDELLEYLRLDKIDWKENPFAWWECQEKHFHYLSILARKYLPIPASSTASERIFSDASNIMGPKRVNMNPELFKKIIFLKRNSKMIPSIHPPKQ